MKCKDLTCISHAALSFLALVNEGKPRRKDSDSLYIML